MYFVSKILKYCVVTFVIYVVDCNNILKIITEKEFVSFISTTCLFYQLLILFSLQLSNVTLCFNWNIYNFSPLNIWEISELTYFQQHYLELNEECWNFKVL